MSACGEPAGAGEQQTADVVGVAAADVVGVVAAGSPRNTTTTASEQPHSAVTPQQQYQQPQQQQLEHQWQQLCGSVAELDSTSDLVVQALLQHSAAAHGLDDTPQQQLQRAAEISSQEGEQQQQQPDSTDELRHQLSALLAEKQRIEADRQDMALQQGKYKGTIAQLEGALAFSERKVKDQLTTIDKLQAQVSSLTAEVQEARGAAAQTPDRCRTAARALQEQADKATTHARGHEAQVKKLKHIVQLEAQQLSELLDFAELERQTLLEKEAALTQELEQVRSRATAAEGGASDALAESAALEQQLQATKEELSACQQRVQELEGLLADREAQLQAAQSDAAVLAAERDAVARNLLRAEAELNDVSDYSTKMFRQVRFISHVLDKNSTMLAKMPEFAGLTRDLRAFVAANARTWEPRDDSRSAATTAGATAGGGGGGGMGHAAAAQPTASMSNADTTASGMRDVAGKS